MPGLAGWPIVDPSSWPLAFGHMCEGCTDCVHRPGPAGAHGGLTAGFSLPVLPQPCSTHPSSSPGEQDVPSARTPTPSKRLLEGITSSLAGKGGLRESAQCLPRAGSHVAPGWELPEAGHGASAPQGCPGLAVRGRPTVEGPLHFRFCLAPPFCVVLPFLVMTCRRPPERKRLPRAAGGAQRWIRSARRLHPSGALRPGPGAGGPAAPGEGPATPR